MTPILVDGPAVEPISLAEMKLFLRVDDAAQDTLIAVLIEAARQRIESGCGRRLVDQTWRLILDQWPRQGVLRVPCGPLRSIAALRIIDADGAAQSLPTALLATDRSMEPARLVLRSSPPAPGSPLNGIEIDLVLGYGPAPGDVPAPLRQALRLLVARWFERRGDDIDAAPLPADVGALLGAYRVARL